MQVTENNAKF